MAETKDESKYVEETAVEEVIEDEKLKELTNEPVEMAEELIRKKSSSGSKKNRKLGKKEKKGNKKKRGEAKKRDELESQGVPESVNEDLVDCSGPHPLTTSPSRRIRANSSQRAQVGETALQDGVEGKEEPSTTKDGSSGIVSTLGAINPEDGRTTSSKGLTKL